LVRGVRGVTEASVAGASREDATMRTIHEIAIDRYGQELRWRLASLEEWPARHSRCPTWLAERIVASMRPAVYRRAKMVAVASAIELWHRASVDHLYRDYRGWQRDGRREGPGSGRSADWLDIGFRAYAALAEAVHDELGFRDNECRWITRTLHYLRGGWEARKREDAAIAALPPCPVEPRYWDRGYSEEHCRRMAGSDPHVARWRLWYEWHGRRAVAERQLAELLARLRDDPTATISGYLAASILAYRRREKGYEGCAGSAYYALVRERPWLWDFLLSRAPHGRRGDGWAIVYPHEDETPYQEAGWYSTFTLSATIWSRRHPVAE